MCASDGSVGDLVEIPSDNLVKRLQGMRTGVRSAARLIERELQDEGVKYRSAMVTLTYRDDEEWHPRDINTLLSHYRKWAERRGAWVRYVWAMELTKRGRPHYHIVFFLPRGVTPPLPDKQGWWRKGSTNAKWARYPVSYISKYASKGFGSGSIPKGAHIWGCSVSSPAFRCRLRWFLAPSWLRKLVPFEDGVRRVRQWWVNAATGWGYLSPWLFDSVGSGSVVLRYVGWSLDRVFIPSVACAEPPIPPPPARSASPSKRSLVLGR